jgi:Zn-dependent M28 family amino/carboxypeptidase
VGTREAGITAPVVRVEALAELEALPDSDVTGRIVFIDALTRRSRDATGYVETLPSRSAGPAAASRKGAVAAVVRSVGTSTSRLAHTGSTSFPEDVTPIPAAALSPADADLLAAQIRTGKTVRMFLKMSSRSLPDGVSANVIGEIRGTRAANEIVLLGAHLDSWDIGTGAVDDGTGVGIVLEAARLIIASGQRPERTLRVVLFANEEFGLTGARAYAEAAAAEEARHVLGMESDLGGGRVWRLDSGVGESGLAAVAAMAELTAPIGAPAGNNRALGGADLKYLREAGMPVLAPRHDASRYFDVHHTIADTVDKVNAFELRQSVAVFLTTAWVAANSSTDFGRFPGALPQTP